jgi:hypothetical protein
VIKADWLAELPTLGLERVTRIGLAVSTWKSAITAMVMSGRFGLPRRHDMSWRGAGTSCSVR